MSHIESSGDKPTAVAAETVALIGYLGHQLQGAAYCGQMRALRTLALWSCLHAGPPVDRDPALVLELLDARAGSRITEKAFVAKAERLRDIRTAMFTAMLGLHEAKRPDAARALVLDAALYPDPLAAARSAINYLYLARLLAAGAVDRDERRLWRFPNDELIDLQWRSAHLTPEQHDALRRSVLESASAVLQVLVCMEGGVVTAALLQ
jgi:hypothetical protein